MFHAAGHELRALLHTTLCACGQPVEERSLDGRCLACNDRQLDFRDDARREIEEL